MTTRKKPLRLLIVDDHESIRDGLRAIFAKIPEWTVCGEAVNGREAVEKARELKPDIIVMDICMPELNGVEAARQIIRLFPKVQVVAYTMQKSEQIFRLALDAGMRGFILKSDESRLLIAAIEALAENKPFFTQSFSQCLLTSVLHPQTPGDNQEVAVGRLSAREREITQLLAEAKTNKEIASMLGVSVKTIDAHRSNIMRKLNLHSITELVRYAIRNRLIEA